MSRKPEGASLHVSATSSTQDFENRCGVVAPRWSVRLRRRSTESVIAGRSGFVIEFSEEERAGLRAATRRGIMVR